MISLASCGGQGEKTKAEDVADEATEEAAGETGKGESEATEETSEEAEDHGDTEVEPNGEIYSLFTSDIHCGVDQGFGYAGLKEIKDNLESQGYAVILVDNGDSIQGESIGLLTKGESVIRIMNEVGYQVWTPGNHEFDYGMDRFFELVDMAAKDSSWTYAEVIEHTNGIDVFIDGHSHDTEQVVMKNKDGEEVIVTLGS